MTRGNIVRQLVGYTIPLVLGNIFQLAYNAVDSMIAGRFIGAEALAATGMAGPVMNIENAVDSSYESRVFPSVPFLKE